MASRLPLLLVGTCVWEPFRAAAQEFDPGTNAVEALNQTDFLLYGVIALALVVAFILAVLILKKLNLGKSSSAMDGLTYLDVSGLKKTGLLTDEEAARVRAAMQKQVERQRVNSSRPTIAGEIGLLADPEIQRLEAEAEAKQKLTLLEPQVPPSVRQGLPESPLSNGQQSRPVFSPAKHTHSQTNPTGGNASFTHHHTSATPADDVPLPPDVLKMVELGLITPEELARIKERIREKRQSL